MTDRICSEEDCGKPHDSRGYCKNHAKKARRNGLPIVLHFNPQETPRDRLYRVGWDVTTGGCWEFRGSRRNGYGCLYVGHAEKLEQAHRVSYRVHIGPIPDGLFVLHSCDNPPCVNPNHLRVGTAKENTQDMIARGRGNLAQGRLGESRSTFTPWTQKLTEDDVRDIRRLHATGATTQELVTQFKISKSQVGKIVTRFQWKHVA